MIFRSAFLSGLVFTAFAAPFARADNPAPLRTGKEAFGDWTQDAPGVRRKITVADLPPPYATPAASNGAKTVAQPEGAWPKVPSGFKVTVFARDLAEPRLLATAPNGDIFVAESSSGRVRILRDEDGDGVADVNKIFGEDLRQPFGVAFYPLGDNPRYVYVGNKDSVVRVAYRVGDLRPGGAPETIVSGIPPGGHWTRNVIFSADGGTMFLAVGSGSNVDDTPGEARRARIFAYNPDGSNERVYATGIRNPVGLALDPATGALWTSVNERDNLGDDLACDYLTRVQEGGFYGWPWFYLGNHQDPRHAGQHPDLGPKTIVPDVLLQAHSASLSLAFYTGSQFPSRFRGSIFAAEHGSWNRAKRTGYKLIFVPVKDGAALGEYEDFMTGFVTPSGDVWGRPVGVTVARDGALLVSDDLSGTIWRIAYVGP